jgi:hypothetical protein
MKKENENKITLKDLFEMYWMSGLVLIIIVLFIVGAGYLKNWK